MGKVYSLRKKIIDVLRENLRGDVLAHEGFAKAVDLVSDVCGLKTQIQRSAVSVVLQEWAGRLCMRDVEYEIGVTIAGIRDALADGKIQPESFSNEIWVPYEIHDVQVHLRPNGAPVYIATIVGLLYPIAGRKIQYVIRNLDMFADVLGFPKKQDVLFRDIYGMWFHGLTKNQDNRILVTKARVNQIQKRHNAELRLERSKPCLVDGSDRLCARCHKGADQCPRATHWATFYKKLCVRGHIGYFDPMVDSNLCIKCRCG